MTTTPTPPTRHSGGRARVRRLERPAGGRELLFLLVAASVLLMLSLASCRDASPVDEDQEAGAGVAAGTVEQGEEAVAYYDSQLAIDTGAGAPDPLALGSSVVEVRLRDDSIELPESLPQGKITFVVTNEGAAEQGLAIAGEGGEYELEAPLAPGASGEIELVLDPGVYRVYSPQAGDGAHGAEGHGAAAPGLVRRLTVTQ